MLRKAKDEAHRVRLIRVLQHLNSVSRFLPTGLHPTLLIVGGSHTWHDHLISTYRRLAALRRLASQTRLQELDASCDL